MAYELLSQSIKLNKRGGPNKSRGSRGMGEGVENKLGGRLLETRE